MPFFGLNHMTVPRLTAAEVLQLAKALGCTGVEFRNDLDGELFGGVAPEAVAEQARAAGLRILALAEVKAFNDPSGDAVAQTRRLATMARACGAEGIALIPQVMSQPIPRPAQRDALRRALPLLRPVLEEAGITGLIEPLGFAKASLRFKDDVVQVLDEIGRPDCFALVHDTFHHHLAQTDGYAPDLTRIVHVSGVENPQLAPADMLDADRVLVSEHDCLGNVTQLQALAAANCTAPASFEAFAPQVHDITDPQAALAGSIAFISAAMQAEAA